MLIQSTVAAIESGLREVGTTERAVGEQRYLKSDLEFLGVAVPQIRRQATTWLRQHPALDGEELRRVVRALWRRRVHELRSFGVELLVARLAWLAYEDLQLVEWILRRANTWAHVDPVAIRIAGPLIDRGKDADETLDRWAVADEMWLRRASLLVHVGPFRAGSGDWRRFERYARAMLGEQEFFIRKAIGWVLREAGRKSPQRVTLFLDSNLAHIHAVTFREAIKTLDAGDRHQLTAAWRAARGRLAEAT